MESELHERGIEITDQILEDWIDAVVADWLSNKKKKFLYKIIN